MTAVMICSVDRDWRPRRVRAVSSAAEEEEEEKNREEERCLDWQ